MNLAKCFGIDLKESDLRVSFKDTREKPPQRTKVKNIDVMMFSTVPCEYFEKEEAKTSFSQDLQEIINIDERIMFTRVDVLLFTDWLSIQISLWPSMV